MMPLKCRAWNSVSCSLSPQTLTLCKFLFKTHSKVSLENQKITATYTLKHMFLPLNEEQEVNKQDLIFTTHTSLFSFLLCLFTAVPPKEQNVCLKYQLGKLQLNHN